MQLLSGWDNMAKTYKTIYGIPLWTITSLSLFIIFSVGYDLVVGDKNAIRYMILAASVLILIISVSLKLIGKDTTVKMARRQLGG